MTFTPPSSAGMRLARFLWFSSFFAAILIISSCKKSDVDEKSDVPGESTLAAKDPLLVLKTADETGIHFQNEILETFDMNITTHINTSNGGGVAVLDANKDGLPDLYFISSSGENKFYVNEGNFKFRDETEHAGLASATGFEVAVTAADVNGDGWLDLYVCRAGPLENDERRNKLFINNGDLTFTEEAERYGLNDKSASMGANFFDFDHDGDLDLYLLNYPVDFSYSSRINLKPSADGTHSVPNLDPIKPYDSDRFYRNDGPPDGKGKGGFVDISKQAGIWNFGYGLSVSIEDFNQDGWMDVYVANDFIQPDLLYINNHDGTFTNRLQDYFGHTSQHSMGTDLSDFDNDGHFDLFAVDMMSKTQYRKKTLLSTNSQNKYNTLIRNGYFEPVVRNVLQRNNGNGSFSDIACMANVFDTDWSWSGLMADLDNDGYKDILVTNGYQREVTDEDFINFKFADIKSKGAIRDQFKDVHDFLNLIPQYKLRNFVFRNRGDLTFEDVSGVWMTIPASWSNGAATADLDADGDLDYIVNNINQDVFIYNNTASSTTNHHYLQFSFVGPPSNAYAIGTRVTLFTGDKEQYQMLTPTRGIFSSVEYLLHFGLDNLSMVDRVEITWPDGQATVLQNVKADQRITVDYNTAEKTNAIAQSASLSHALFTNVTTQSHFSFHHQENDYIDFEYTFLLPWALSDLGPLMDTADVNHDGLTDFYIGNSFNKSGGLYIQKPSGEVQLISPEVWASDSIYEDHGSLFFDADLDGDKDLLVISGGYESTSPAAWTPRLYINDGNNVFKKAPGALPACKDVCLRAAALDFDGDQDIDLFLGGRVSPGKYPSAPESYIFRNDRNKFVDVTDEIAPEFRHCGMVSDLQFVNLDDDAQPELVVVGEYMAITVFDWKDGKWNKLDGSRFGFEKSNGFWNRLVVADVDSDGDPDLITGNLGLNSQYRANVTHPVQCYVADYDGNGSLDPLITVFEGDKTYPIIQRDVMIKQLPVMKKRFIYSKEYAVATIEDILTPKQIKESTILNCYMLESGWWENKDGHFVFHPFPSQGQWAPVNSIVTGDFDGDGNTDIFLAGNKYKMEVETGRLDAGIGTFFKGDGHGHFSWLSNMNSGLWATRDTRDVAVLKGQGHKTLIVVSSNNSEAQIFSSGQ